jgi:hypothetical protein
MFLSLSALRSDKVRRILVPSGASVCDRYGGFSARISYITSADSFAQKMSSAWYARLSSPTRVMLANVDIVKYKGMILN